VIGSLPKGCREVNWETGFDRPRRLLGAAALLLILAAGLARAEEGAPVVVELFTSQGCSSCPPADALLRELAAHPDLLPLAFHVDYWNDLGWIDPFSSAAFTRRQQDYAAARGFEVFTPQLVVEGREDVVGSSRTGVSQAIASASREARSVESGIVRNGESVTLAVGAVRDAKAAADARADIYLLSFDSSDTTAIQAGENSGRKLVYANVVRSMRKVGEWRNQPLNLNEHLRPEERGDRLALLVQDRGGAVWALASTPAMHAK
jgi:hypothetical protein